MITGGADWDWEVLQGEIETCMKLLGVKEVSELGPKFVSTVRPVRPLRTRTYTIYDQINSRMVERDIFDGGSGLDRDGLWEARAKL